jgi:hypothetical protein
MPKRKKKTRFWDEVKTPKGVKVKFYARVKPRKKKR